ncbi:MAG: N-acetylmuramic acid 6-phosphate etherase [Vampirovibrionales bacterium]|nr:N-acetylmuramic acid 6-phosphate etherase [Vampirovibrionales bacterium]
MTLTHSSSSDTTNTKTTHEAIDTNDGISPVDSECLSPTEQDNPNTRNIDACSTLETLRLINAEDQTVAHAVQAALPQIAGVVDRIVAGFLQQGRLIYVGAGTSGRLAVLDASECPPTFGAPPQQVQAIIAGGEIALKTAVEGAEDNAALGAQDLAALSLTPNDVVVGISASGGAAYVIAALQTARQAGAFTAAVTCNPKALLLNHVDAGIVTPVGPEVISGSTRLKAGTAQKLVLNMLTTASMVHIGKTYGNVMVDVQPVNDKLRKRALRIVSTLARVSTQAAQSALTASQWQVKPAVLMAARGCSLSEAQALLSEHQGKLKPLV